MIDFTVRRIDVATAKAYIHEHHYTHGSHNRPSPCYGLFDEESLIGVLMFATPCSERVRRSVFGPGYENAVVELHRLHVQDGTPRNTESWFIARCLRMLAEDRPQTAAVVSFADQSQGHVGTIYQATNAIYYGTSASATFFLDQNGRLRHPRQNGKNVDGVALGWVPVKRKGKHRYLWLIGDKRKTSAFAQLLRVKERPYPKLSEVVS